MTNCKNFHSRYVLRAMEDHCLNGDAYVAEDILYHRCKERQRGLSYATFKADLAEQIRLGYIHPEGSHLYINRTWRYEEDASKQLVTILRQPTLPAMAVPENLSVNGIALCQEQRAAVELALTNKLSLILGGAGCGKSTLIRAIVNMVGAGHSMVLCAPTGKAARNLEKRTGLSARTVHSALGMHPDEDFLAPVTWNTTQLVVVDEASMMTLEMLAGILHRVPKICRVVLLGDPNQLLSVGSGNVLPDLLALGVPCARLELNHRQDDEAEALLHNVVDFKKLHSKPDLAFDQSFCLHEMGTAEIKEAVTEEAVRRFAQGESVQVLSPYNNKGNLSAYALNMAIRDRVNPLERGKIVLKRGKDSFRDNDRVIILQNDRERNCSNGDVGILHILKVEGKRVTYCVELPDGRCPTWDDASGLAQLSLAYCLTVHKSQGSEYDTILLPIAKGMDGMLSRISRPVWSRKSTLCPALQFAGMLNLQNGLTSNLLRWISTVHMHASVAGRVRLQTFLAPRGGWKNRRLSKGFSVYCWTPPVLWNGVFWQRHWELSQVTAKHGMSTVSEWCSATPLLMTRASWLLRKLLAQLRYGAVAVRSYSPELIFWRKISDSQKRRLYSLLLMVLVIG